MTSWVVYRHPKTGRFASKPRKNRPRVPVVIVRDPRTRKARVVHDGNVRRSVFPVAQERRVVREKAPRVVRRRPPKPPPPKVRPFRVYYGIKTPWNLVRIKFRVVRHEPLAQLRRAGLLDRDIFWISGRIAKPTSSRATGRSLVETMRDYYLELFLSKGYNEELTPLLGSIARVGKYRMRLPTASEQVRRGRR